METQIMREVAMLLERDIEDPRIKDVTLSHIKITPDLRQAKIFFTLLDEKKIEKVTYALNHSVTYLRRRIGETLKLRVVPELFFIYDKSLEEAERLVNLIDSLNSNDPRT
jgi:ribosome-binding factor A